MSAPAPIVVFAYNRPEHLRLALNCLAKADLASESPLWVFADGPRGVADSKSVAAVGSVLSEPVWRENFSSVEVVSARRNKGLANSVISGVSTVLESHDRV
ncbi:MAG: glycosyltransferase family 2 protein, partial [Gammaproteobacteria bacterium]|nr:glycosyltransferase family 2 protein [Gammaproteobacteria bacterium]